MLGKLMKVTENMTKVGLINQLVDKKQPHKPTIKDLRQPLNRTDLLPKVTMREQVALGLNINSKMLQQLLKEGALSLHKMVPT